MRRDAGLLAEERLRRAAHIALCQRPRIRSCCRSGRWRPDRSYRNSDTKAFIISLSKSASTSTDVTNVKARET